MPTGDGAEMTGYERGTITPFGSLPVADSSQTSGSPGGDHRAGRRRRGPTHGGPPGATAQTSRPSPRANGGQGLAVSPDRVGHVEQVRGRRFVRVRVRHR
jgi:hypothetical protein